MFTHHSQARMQQRSVPASAVNRLMDYGEARRHQRANAMFLTKRSRNMVLRHFGKAAFREPEKSLNAYLSVVMKALSLPPSTVITVLNSVDT